MKAFVEIDDKLDGRIRRLAERCRQKTDDFIRDAIVQHAERLEAREDFIEEADASWEAYQTNGLHLTGTEIRAWLKTVGTENESPLPECRLTPA